MPSEIQNLIESVASGGFPQVFDFQFNLKAGGCGADGAPHHTYKNPHF